MVHTRSGGRSPGFGMKPARGMPAGSEDRIETERSPCVLNSSMRASASSSRTATISIPCPLLYNRLGFSIFPASRSSSLPKRGMHQITEHLMHLALEAGVQFKFGCAVDSIVVEHDRVLGVQCQQQLFPSDLVVSDADIHLVYRQLLPQKYYPKKLLAQEKSSRRGRCRPRRWIGWQVRRRPT